MTDLITAEEAGKLAHKYRFANNDLERVLCETARTVIALHAQLADAQAAQAMVVERAAEAVKSLCDNDEWNLALHEALSAIRALAPIDGLALVRELRDRAEKAEAELQRFHEERSYVVGANDGWDAAVEQGEASPAVGKAMVRFWKRMANLHLARTEAAEAERDRLAAANAALEARLANGMKWCDLMDGPVSKSQFVNGQATAAQQIRAALAEVQADARREGGE